MTYCMADIHGEYDKFMRLLDIIRFSDDDVLYVLGDVIDRGPKPITVLLEMMNYSNIIPIVGNHELFALSCLPFLMKEVTEENVGKLNMDMIENLLSWQRNGSETTITEFRKLDDEQKQDVIDYMMEFSAYEQLSVNGKDYILVHSGFENFKPDRPIDNYQLDELTCGRTDYSIQYFPDKYVVSGHTPTAAISINPKPFYIFRANNHIAIDCGACFKQGRLAAICLETGEEFYSEK